MNWTRLATDSYDLKDKDLVPLSLSFPFSRDSDKIMMDQAWLCEVLQSLVVWKRHVDRVCRRWQRSGGWRACSGELVEVRRWGPVYTLKCEVANLGRCRWSGARCHIWKQCSKLRRKVVLGALQFDFRFCIQVLLMRHLPWVRQHFQFGFNGDILTCTKDRERAHARW